MKSMRLSDVKKLSKSRKIDLLHALLESLDPEEVYDNMTYYHDLVKVWNDNTEVDELLDLLEEKTRNNNHLVKS